MPEFEYWALCDLEQVIDLSVPNFLICKMGMTAVTTSEGALRLKCVHSCTELRGCCLRERSLRKVSSNPMKVTLAGASVPRPQHKECSEPLPLGRLSLLGSWVCLGGTEGASLAPGCPPWPHL